jgi:hypothetical protein
VKDRSKQFYAMSSQTPFHYCNLPHCLYNGKIPTINVVLVEIKNQSYHGRCFLNIDNVANLKV